MLVTTPESLFLNFRPKIQSYIYRRTSDPDITNDLTSLVFHKATEAMLGGKGPRASISGWLYRTAHNAVIDHYRARDRHKDVCLDDCPNHPSDDDPLVTAISTEQRTYLLRTLNRLNEAQQQVIRMRFLEGYSFAEIAQAMDRTEGAVKAIQHRALMTLRAMIHE